MDAHREHGSNHYGRMAIELAVDFVIMYFVMYTMIATAQHLRLNLNNVYMMLMMVAPMAIVMLVAMRSMFRAATAAPSDSTDGRQTSMPRAHLAGPKRR